MSAPEERIEVEMGTGEGHRMETELRTLRPWRPSEGLRERIAEAAREAGEANRGLDGFEGDQGRSAATWGWRAAALVTSLLAVGAWTRQSEPGRTSAPPHLRAESADTASSEVPGREPDAGAKAGNTPWKEERLLLSRETDGLVRFEQGPPMWRVRYRILNRAEWKEPDSGVVREHFEPEEGVLFLPVQYQ